MNRFKVILFFVYIIFFSCVKHKETKIICNLNHLHVIKMLSYDVLNTKQSTIQIIKKYFFEPDEILNNVTDDELLIYMGSFYFFKRYLKEGIGYLNLTCGWKMLRTKNFKYLFDINTYKQIVSLSYYNKKWHFIDTMSFYFKGSKIYSVIPIDNHNGGVIWVRLFSTLQCSF